MVSFSLPVLTPIQCYRNTNEKKIQLNGARPWPL